MALQKTITTASGIVVQDAYHRVTNVCLEGKDKINFSLQSSIDAENVYFNSQVFSCDYDLDGLNPIRQAYDYLKTLSKFADATDV
jgi:hypothetical protein